MSLEVNIEKKLDGFTLRAAFTAGNTSTALLGASGCGKHDIAVHRGHCKAGPRTHRAGRAGAV